MRKFFSDTFLDLTRASRSSLSIMVALSLVVATACGGAQPAASTAPSAAAATSAAAASGTPSVDAQEQALVAAAKAEGQLFFYSGLDEVTVKNLGDAFKAKYGITVSFTRIAGITTMIARYTSEADAGQYPADLLIATYDPFLATDGLAKGLLKPITADLVPRTRDIPAKFVGKSTIGVSLALLSQFAINTAKVPAANVPKTFKDMLDPFWKNQIYISDVKTVSIVLAVYDLLRDKYGDDYLKQFAAQNPQYVASMVSGVQLIAAGERLAGLATQVHLNPLLATAPTAPVKLVPMSDVEFGYDWELALSAKSQHQNAARLFSSWLLSPEGQLILNKTVGSSVRPDVTVPGFPSVGPNFINLDVGKALKNRSTILKLVGVSE